MSKNLKPQLNQIRSWVQQGRTNAWIAHQLDVTGEDIDAFKRENGLAEAGDAAVTANEEVDLRAEDDAAVTANIEAEVEQVNLRANTFEGTFDHGSEGYGLWLDPAVQDSPIYAEHWAGHRAIDVVFEADQIIIKRI